MQFSFISVVPNYLNFTTIQRPLSFETTHHRIKQTYISTLAPLEHTVPMLEQSNYDVLWHHHIKTHAITDKIKIILKQFTITRTMIYSRNNKHCTLSVIYIYEHQNRVQSIRKIVAYLSPSGMTTVTSVQHVISSIHIALLSYNNPPF